MLGVLLLWQIFFADARICLPEAISEAQRQNITLHGVSGPILLAAGDWDSALAGRDTYSIIVSEVMGYNIDTVYSGGSTSTLRFLGGCGADESGVAVPNCSFPPVTHVGFEIWGSTLSSDAWINNIQSMGEKRPTLLGSMGYSGVEGLYVMGRARQASQDANGVHLSYYGNLNASWFNPATYAATVSDVNISLLKTCVQWTNDALAPQLYLDATGDADGVMDVNGTKFFKCYQDKWWAPPACRANPTTCLSSVTGGTGWGLTELVQQAFFHNIPVAFALAESSATYRVINKEIQSFMYWWMPDSSFVQYDPTLVEFPPFNFAEYRDGIFKSQIGVIELSIATAAGFELAADRAFALADNMLLSDSVMSGMLLDFVNAGSSDMWQTACDWLKANRNIWEGWVPDQTKCNPGLGLVDLQGDFTESLTGAVSCAICPAGRASMELGDTDTRVCSLCPAGTYQSTFRASECMSCELGKIAETEGMTECQDCGLGEYANATGMSSCYRCGAGTGQEDLWTTSKEVTSDGKVVVLQLLGASSQSLCACDAGSFLWEGRCEVCTEGATCPGANRLELMPGYYSTPDLPGEVYNCYSEQTCPGGVPGTCAAGRDSSSVACAECLEGYQEREDRSCGPCREGDYAFFVLVVAGFVGIVVLVYVVLKNEKTGKDRSSLLMMASGLAQCITVIQILSVIRRFNIDWREPFRSVLIFMEVLSLDVDMFSVSCIGRLNPVSLFGARAMMIPMFLGAALVVHLFWLLISRSKSFRVADLLRTCGTIFMVLFIVLFSVLLAPFQCNLHPNGSYTVKRYPTVFCDGTGQHTEMFWLGGFACLMPISFLVVCSYVVLVEMPKRVAKSDAPFLAAISFLTKRFRPGMEMSSVWLLVRNAAVVATPLLYTTAAQLLMMSVILALNLTLVASYKPWRFMVCNWLDNLLLCGLLIIVQVGSVTVENSDPQATMVVAMTFLTIMTLGVLSIVLLSGYKYFQQKFRKQFRFFTCHQKSAAGSMARLLKMELEQRLPGTKTFLDCDDLNDLTRLFSYVGQDTETFLVLCSPAILTRKWCVGEMVTARANKVSTLLLTWGDFSLPDERFIDNYPNVVPDITELVKHGITLADVEDTFRWLRVQNQVPMPEMVTPTTFATVASELCAVSSSESSQKAVSVFGHETFTNFPILVDPHNSESVATAMILAVMLKPRLVGTEFPLPSILKLDAEVPKNATLSIIICTNTCFKSKQMQSWLLQACSLDDCCMMPVIADDPFMMPSDAFWADLRSTSSLEETQLRLYSLVVQSIFQEIAVVFVPQGYFSTQDDLELRANQAASRLTAKLQPLKDKVEKLERLQQSEKGEGGETLEAIEELKNEAAVSQDTTQEGDGEEAGPEPPMITQTF